MQTPQEVVKQWTARLMATPELARNLNARYKFIVAGKGGGSWIFDCSSDVPVVSEYSTSDTATPEADCTLSMNSSVFVEVATGKLNPQVAVITQEIEIEGDMGLALRLSEFI